jgi:hypothetical protein
MRAVVRFALASLLCTTGAAADVLHLADGSRVAGKLTFCDDEACSINKRRVSRQQITQITLRPLSSPPPLRETGAILTDGTTRRGAFTGLTLGYVEIGGEEIDRETVAMIILEAARADDPPPGGTPDAPSPAPPPAPPSAPPITPPPSAPAPPPPQRSAGTPRRGGLWIGTMEGRGWGTTNGIFGDLRISVQVRLREYISPEVILKDGQIKTVGTKTQLEPEGTVVRNVYRCRAEGFTCSGEGSTSVTVAFDQQGVGHASWIIRPWIQGPREAPGSPRQRKTAGAAAPPRGPPAGPQESTGCRRSAASLPRVPRGRSNRQSCIRSLGPETFPARRGRRPP